MEFHVVYVVYPLQGSAWLYLALSSRSAIHCAIPVSNFGYACAYGISLQRMCVEIPSRVRDTAAAPSLRFFSLYDFFSPTSSPSCYIIFCSFSAARELGSLASNYGSVAVTVADLYQTYGRFLLLLLLRKR